MRANFLLFIFIFAFVACEEESSSEFAPNNLISEKENRKAEEELANQTGPPVIKSFTLSSSGVYDVGESIIINAKFSKRTVITNGGTPRIPIDIGGVTRYATYTAGSDSADYILHFQYTIQAGDLDHDGIELVSPWELNGAIVQDYVDQDADLTFTPPSTTSRRVDTANISITFPSGSYINTANATINITSSTGTELYVSDTCNSGGSTEAMGASISYAIPNLNSANTVYVSAGNGTGGYSQCDSLTINHDNQAPNTVGGITVSNDASDIRSDSTTWSSTTDNGLSGIDYYEIAISTTTNSGGIIASGNWTDIGNNLAGSIDNGTTPYLSALTNYYTLIRAVDRAGNTGTEVASPVWQVAALSPEQITSMSVITATDDSLKVGWPYPDDNGFPITDYIIQYRLDGATTWITISDGVSTDRRYTLTGLDSEEDYEFRVRAYNGTNYGPWSPTLDAETLPSIDFITTPYIAINVGGATNNQLVSLEDDNEIYYGNNSASTYNDNSQISADLDKGMVVSVPANDFTVVRGTKPFFIAGRLGSGGDANKANVVWQTADWIGKSFLFSHSRSNPMKVKVYAFTDSVVTVTKNYSAVTNGVASIDEEEGHVFTISSYGSYEINSTGFIMVYGYAAGNGSQYVDPKPFLPSSNDLIGIPSRSAKVSSATTGNGYDIYHSDAVNQSRTANAGSTDSFNSRGISSTYQDEAVRLRANENIVANSYADANGSCSAPLVPSAFQKSRFALNVTSEWVAFASTNELTITITEPNATYTGFETPVTINMTRSGANNNTPTKGYYATDLRAGTIIEGSAPFQAYYEPKNDTNGADNDETVMFGWD